MKRTILDEQLAILNRELVQMGALCEEAIRLTAQALAADSSDLNQRIEALEAESDRQEHLIESLCLRILLQQQPVARDLRQISAALKMITDLERIGDQAADIAEILDTLASGALSGGALGSRVKDMAAAVIGMVTGSVDAYVKQNVELARAVVLKDDEVDADFERVKAALIELIRHEPSNGEYALDFLMIAKYFERIGDHAVNVAECVCAVQGVPARVGEVSA